MIYLSINFTKRKDVSDLLFENYIIKNLKQPKRRTFLQVKKKIVFVVPNWKYSISYFKF